MIIFVRYGRTDDKLEFPNLYIFIKISLGCSRSAVISIRFFFFYSPSIDFRFPRSDYILLTSRNSRLSELEINSIEFTFWLAESLGCPRSEIIYIGVFSSIAESFGFPRSEIISIGLIFLDCRGILKNKDVSLCLVTRELEKLRLFVRILERHIE